MNMVIASKERVAGVASLLGSIIAPALTAAKSVVVVGAGVSGGMCAAGGVLLVGGALTMDPFMAIAGGWLMTACRD